MSHPGRCRIVAISGYRLLRDALREALRQDGLELVAEFDSVVDAKQFDCDLGLVEAELLHPFMLACPQVPVLAVGVPPGADELARRVMLRGAGGCLARSASRVELLTAISVVREGGRYLDPQLSAALLKEPEAPPYTRREIQVLGCLAGGMRNGEIAAQLHLSVSTVKCHVRSLFGKLAVNDRTQLLAEAFRRGLVSPA